MARASTVVGAYDLLVGAMAAVAEPVPDRRWNGGARNDYEVRAGPVKRGRVR
jgi:hypothetical protein